MAYLVTKLDKIEKMTHFGVKKMHMPPRSHKSDRTVILQRNYHFDKEEQNCQISFLKNR